MFDPKFIRIHWMDIILIIIILILILILIIVVVTSHHCRTRHSICIDRSIAGVVVHMIITFDLRLWFLFFVVLVMFLMTFTIPIIIHRMMNRSNEFGSQGPLDM